MKDINKAEKKVKYEGELDLAGFKLSCYVLEDGTRILSGRGMQEALKMTEEDNKYSSGGRLVENLSQKSLQPFIHVGGKAVGFEPIPCSKGDLKINGYEATVLPDICNIYLEARRNIHLSPRQRIIADQCEILLRSFAKVGIIALVDEVTGYQYEREKTELQAILKIFISEEILKWQKTFPWTFYKEIFRLWGLPFTVENIKRPGFIGTLTNELVYKNMPKGTIVLEKLKEKTPKTVGGNYRCRFHQSLTPEIGREELKRVINSVETLASISKDKNEFFELMKRKYSSQKEIRGELKGLEEASLTDVFTKLEKK